MPVSGGKMMIDSALRRTFWIAFAAAALAAPAMADDYEPTPFAQAFTQGSNHPGLMTPGINIGFPDGGGTTSIVAESAPLAPFYYKVAASADYGIARTSAKLVANPALPAAWYAGVTVSSEFLDRVTINTPDATQGTAVATVQITGQISGRLLNPFYNPTGVERFYSADYLADRDIFGDDGDSSFSDLTSVSSAYSAGLYSYDLGGIDIVRNEMAFSYAQTLWVEGFANTDEEGRFVGGPVSDRTFRLMRFDELAPFGQPVPIDQQYISFSRSVSASLDLSYSFVSGEARWLGFYNQCEVFIYGGEVECNFGNTAKLTGFQIFDQNNNSVTEFTAFSQSVGRDVARGYPALNSDVVPEPGTWTLLMAGFGLTGAVLRRRQATAPSLD